jgi:cell division protein FtsL
MADRRASARATDQRQAYYIDGNTIRRSEAVPDYRTVRRRHIEDERELRRRNTERARRIRNERELRTSRSYVVFLTMVVLVFGTIAGLYINLQSDVTAKMKSIASLETKIEDVRAENDEAYKRINTSVDLEAIRDTAMNELGMSYAKESQIIYYSVSEDDYMNQYGEIPEK